MNGKHREVNITLPSGNDGSFGWNSSNPNYIKDMDIPGGIFPNEYGLYESGSKQHQ